MNPNSSENNSQVMLPLRATARRGNNAEKAPPVRGPGCNGHTGLYRVAAKETGVAAVTITIAAIAERINPQATIQKIPSVIRHLE